MIDMNKWSYKKIGLMIVIPSFFKVVALAVLLNAPQAHAAPSDGFADLAEKLLPTVVNISTTQKMEEQTAPNYRRLPAPNFPQFPEGHPFNDLLNDFFGQPLDMMPQQQRLPATSLGSGFVIDVDKGLIITNNHVIDGADEIKITLHDDTILPAEIIGIDDKTDLAVLKANLKGEKVAAAKFGDSDDMRVGDWVLAIGNPFGLGGTVTAGIISARQRDINSGPYDDYLQTDASINRGNSGGPMFNMKGEVIGINTAIFSPTGGSVGIGFAIPSTLAEPVVQQLTEFGRTRRGWLGVKIQAVTEDIASGLGLEDAKGALVAEATPTGPAEKAGIKTGDVILSFNGRDINEMRELPRIVAETPIDKDVPVVVWREGKKLTLKANIGELEKAEDEGLLAAKGDKTGPASVDEIPGTELPDMGLTVSPLNKALRQKYAINDNVEGVIITDAGLNSDAARKGLSEGDVIVEMNRHPVKSVEDAQAVVKAVQSDKRDTVLVLINRGGEVQFVAVKLEQGDKE